MIRRRQPPLSQKSGQTKNLAHDPNMKANRLPLELLLQVELAGGRRKGRKGLSNDGPIIIAGQQQVPGHPLTGGWSCPTRVMINTAAYLIL